MAKEKSTMKVSFTAPHAASMDKITKLVSQFGFIIVKANHDMISDLNTYEVSGPIENAGRMVKAILRRYPQRG